MGYRWYCFKLWLRTRPEKIAWWLAWRLPRKVAYLAFIRVYASSGDGPGPEFSRALDAWERQ